MAELLLIGIFIVAYWIYKTIQNEKLENYDISKIDNTKLTRDMCNGVSLAERRRRCVNGYYDKK